jgi:hypothetical protein
MANAASVTISATVLPDEIAKTISGGMTVTPDDANDKWYYKLTSVPHNTGGVDLIQGTFLSAETTGTAHDTVSTSDKVKFLFVKNTDADEYLVMSITAGTAAFNLADTIWVGPGESWFGRLPNTTVASIHAISSDVADAGEAAVEVIVAALIDDV